MLLKIHSNSSGLISKRWPSSNQHNPAHARKFSLTLKDDSTTTLCIRRQHIQILSIKLQQDGDISHLREILYRAIIQRNTYTLLNLGVFSQPNTKIKKPLNLRFRLYLNKPAPQMGEGGGGSVLFYILAYQLLEKCPWTN